MVDSSTTPVAHEEDGHAPVSGATDLAIFTGAGAGPKLEDFLGGSGGSAGMTTTATPSLPQFSTETAIALPETELYDSELKTIAASFLRGYSSSEQTGTGRDQLPVAPAEPVSKKTVDTFGQRTSIYRGVTR